MEIPLNRNIALLINKKEKNQMLKEPRKLGKLRINLLLPGKRLCDQFIQKYRNGMNQDLKTKREDNA